MSFTTKPEVQLVKTTNGVELTNVELLSLADLQKLERLSIEGKEASTFIHTSVFRDVVDETVYKNQSAIMDAHGLKQLNSILAKY